MSIYFERGGRTLWEPASRVGRSFVRVADGLASEMGVPSGFLLNDDDTCGVESGALTEFARRLLGAYEKTSHPIQRDMIIPVLLASLVMLDRDCDRVDFIGVGDEIRERKAAYARLMA